MPIASIIIPAFNAAPFLSRAVQSALAQSVADIEIIIVDDGSTDSTSALMASLAATDPRIITLALPQNRGVSAARNTALARATGDWIALLDADDEFAPNRLQSLLAAASRQHADMVADNLRMSVFASGALAGLAFPDAWMSQSHATTRYILERDIPGIFSREIGFIKPIIRRELLTRHAITYDETLHAAEDLLLYITCLQAGARLCLVPEAGYTAALRDNSLSARGDANLDSLRVNHILRAMLGAEYRALLDLRQDAVSFELFIWWTRQCAWSRALTTAVTINTLFLLQKLAVAISRRLGLKAANPAKIRLAKLWMVDEK